MSSFDEDKNFAVFKYVVDSVKGEATEHAGDIVAFVRANNTWDAVEKAGFKDLNAYGANRVDKLEDYTKAITDERKLLKKISKQLKAMIDAENAENKSIEGMCPNGCGKMDEHNRCDKCKFGFEYEIALEEIEKEIERVNADGGDTTELETLKDMLNGKDE